ncbi:39S ribosomal protein L46, mitochondrial [Aplysia californica]|uniref:Large ribosomal subunit protein mL46 n=1 Tax=Aplysia californica TaxID=6500 RepID=A0ABM0K4M8_APLCA|nr:39S ribosomal protein L46, mitochondrial [Aplysia californica]
MSASTCRNFSKAVSFLARWHSSSRAVSDLSFKRHISTSQQVLKNNVLYTAVCVERCPVITAEKTKLEQEFSDLMSTIELENSVLSDHELRRRREDQAAKRKKENEEEEGNPDAETETALDLEDKWDAELKAFTAASRRTAADESGDRRSLDRCLDSSLYLLVKQNIGGKDHWVLPQAEWEQGETMKQTAERALTSVCGDVKASFLGGAPSAVAKFDLPDPQEEKGVKLFFYKAWYREGDVTPNTDVASDYVWVTKKELSQYCHRGYKKQLKKFLL